MARSEETPDPHPHSMMNSDEVDWLVYSYLLESGYAHTSFSLLHESSLAGPSASSSTQANGRKHHTNGAAYGTPVPPGHLVRILQKGLLYLEAEARYRGDPPEPAPRIIGYPIPNALPLPPLPKYRPVASSSTPPAAAPPAPPPAAATEVPAPAASAPTPAPSRAPTSKDKGKGKEKEIPNGKRKGSDREDGSDGKRPRTASGEKKKGAAAAAAATATNAASTSTTTNGDADDSAMEVDKEPTATAAAPPSKPSTNKASRSASPATARSQSPTLPRKPKPVDATAVPPAASSASSTSALANNKSLLSHNTHLHSSVSAPTTPSIPSSAQVPPPPPSTTTSNTTLASTERRASLPETTKKQQDELAKVKKEEAELLLNEKKEKKVEVDMTNVLQLGAENGQVLRLRGHTVPKVQPCSWNPKVPALLATGGGDSTCRIWDVPKTWAPKDGEGQILKDNVVCKHSSAQRRADVAAVAWDPSGSLLATGSEDGIARIWTPSGDLHLVLSMHQRTIFSLKWNTAGTMLLTGSLDNTVCLWELNSGKVKQQWSTHSDSVLDVDWNDDTTFASASMDKAIHLFAINRVSPVHRFKGHRDEVNVVKFSPCGTLLASCSDDATVRIWSLRNIPGLSLGNKVTEKDETRLIDDEDHAGVLVLEGHTSDVHTIAWAPRSKEGDGPRLIASASFDATAKLWDADLGTCLQTFARHSDFVYSIAFSPGLGKFLATGSNDGKMDVWNIEEKKLMLEYEHAGPVYEIAWKGDGSQLAVCGRTADVACVGFKQD